MIDLMTRPKAAALTLAGTLVAITAVAGAGFAHSTETAMTDVEKTGTYCEVVSTQMGNGIGLEAVFHTEKATQVSYRFSVKSSGGAGGTNINQGGGAMLPEAGDFSLGKITVGGSPRYDITLDIEANGETYSCGGTLDA